jgi:hypothetical protein
MVKNQSDNDLLIRIDERQKEMSKDILAIKNKLETVVTNEKCIERQTNFSKDFMDLRNKTNTMWDERNKLLGYMIGAGMAGGGISAFLVGAVKAVMASF